MFAIYNNGSVAFRSTVDNLYQLKKTDAPNEANLNPDDDTLFQEYLNSKKEDKEKQDNASALNAYKKIANLDVSEQIYHVNDIMTKTFIHIDTTATVLETYQLLKEHTISQVPVLTKDKKIVGVISYKMILNLLMEDMERINYILEKMLDELVFDEVLTTDPITDIRRVAKVMIDFKMDTVPVVDEEAVLVGIVSKTDIIKAVSNIPRLQLWS